MKEKEKPVSKCASQSIPSNGTTNLLIWILLSILSALTTVCTWIYRRIRLLYLGSKFPGSTAYPFIGNVLDFFPANAEAVRKYYLDCFNKYGPIIRVYFGPLLLITTGKIEDQEKILSGNEYNSKGQMYTFLKPWLGEGLLISSGEKWKSRRKILTPAFHFKILDQFVPVFHSCGEEFLQQLRKCADGRPLDVWPLVKLFTLDVICETTMGVKINAQTDSASPYVTAVNDISGIVYERAGRPWLYLPFFFRFSELGRRHQKCLDILHGTSERVIRERKAELQKLKEEDKVLDVDDLGRKRRVAFLDLLLLAARDGSLSDADIREEVDTFMFEGHDTTAAALSFTIFLLSRHPQVQDKLIAELESLFDPSKPLEALSLEQLSDLKYTEMVIKESMRIYPPVGCVSRDITSDFPMASCPRTIPAGTEAFLSFYLLHRAEENFPDPEKFDPERFSAEECARRNPFAYLPFSAGSRNCIGQRFAMLELKSVLAKVVWNFHIMADPDYEPKEEWEIITKTSNGISIRLQERRRGTMTNITIN